MTLILSWSIGKVAKHKSAHGSVSVFERGIVSFFIQEEREHLQQNSSKE